MNCESRPPNGLWKKERNASAKSAHGFCRWRETGMMILLLIAGSEWPQGAFATAQSPFAICIFGKDPFGNSLDEALASKTIADRPIVIQRTKDKMELRQCQMVFVSHSEAERVADVVAQLEGTNVLLVGESEGFAESGGMIEFTLEQGRVRFSINPDAAEHANLRLSSKLLALAKIVHGAAHPRGG